MCMAVAGLALAPGGLSAATTIATVGAVVSDVGMAFQAMNAMNQSQAQENYYNYQAQIDRNNAQIAQWNADDAIQRGQVAEDAQRRKTALLKGSQTASLAARGIDISEGSALNILADTDWMGETDALTVRSNAEKEAWSYRNQSSGYKASAGANSARADAESPLLAGAGSLMASAGSVAGKWYKMGAGAEVASGGASTLPSTGPKWWES